MSSSAPATSVSGGLPDSTKAWKASNCVSNASVTSRYSARASAPDTTVSTVGAFIR